MALAALAALATKAEGEEGIRNADARNAGCDDDAIAVAAMQANSVVGENICFEIFIRGNKWSVFLGGKTCCAFDCTQINSMVLN